MLGAYQKGFGGLKVVEFALHGESIFSISIVMILNLTNPAPQCQLPCSVSASSETYSNPSVFLYRLRAARLLRRT